MLSVVSEELKVSLGRDDGYGELASRYSACRSRCFELGEERLPSPRGDVSGDLDIWRNLDASFGDRAALSPARRALRLQLAYFVGRQSATSHLPGAITNSPGRCHRKCLLNDEVVRRRCHKC
jgi:hypothetical protein